MTSDDIEMKRPDSWCLQSEGLPAKSQRWSWLNSAHPWSKLRNCVKEDMLGQQRTKMSKFSTHLKSMKSTQLHKCGHITEWWFTKIWIRPIVLDVWQWHGCCKAAAGSQQGHNSSCLGSRSAVVNSRAAAVERTQNNTTHWMQNDMTTLAVAGVECLCYSRTCLYLRRSTVHAAATSLIHRLEIFFFFYRWLSVFVCFFCCCFFRVHWVKILQKPFHSEYGIQATVKWAQKADDWEQVP